MGCSSLVVSGKATQDGGLIHARNLDLDGICENLITVAFCEPEDGQKYVMFTTAGLHFPGLTAWNESGITLNGNMNHTMDVSARGDLYTAIGGKIIREAKSIDDALKIIRGSSPAVGYAMIISDAKTSEGVSVEISHSRLHVVRQDQNVLVTTNHYRGEALQADEYVFSPAALDNTIGRYHRLEQLARENYGKIDVQKVVSFMGDHQDYFSGRQRATENVIAQMTNYLSIVLEPQKRRFWIGTGPPPSCNFVFAGFDIEKEFPGETAYELPQYSGEYTGSEALKGLRLYVAASHDYIVEHNRHGAAEHIAKARTLDDREPVYPFVEALLRLELGEFSSALELFPKALAQFERPYRRAKTLLWWGRTLDLTGDRAGAVEKYRSVENMKNVFAPLKKEAAAGMKKPFSPKRLTRLILDFPLGDG